jgi:predicted RNA methylase
MKDILKSKRFFYTDPSKSIVRTPEDLAKEMISKIPDHIFESDSTTFLDPACGKGTFLRIISIILKEKGHASENIKSRIFGIDIDSNSGVKQPQHFFGKENVIVDDFLSMKKPNQWPDKFDVIVSNPPYGTRTNKLDLKFIEKSISISKQYMVFVHPASSYIDTKGKNKTYIESNKIMTPYVEKVILFNGNGVFGISLYTPCSIVLLNKNKTRNTIDIENKILNRKDTISDFSELTLWGKRNEFFSFKEKISNYIDSNGGSLHSNGNVLGSRGVPKIKNRDSYFVEFTPIRGHGDYSETSMHKDDFFTIIKKDSVVCHNKDVRYIIWFEFDSEIKANNFLSYIKTDFARMCLALSKTNSTLFNGELKTIPWLDFSQKWNDVKLFKHFGVTKNEQEFIKEIIPSYY